MHPVEAALARAPRGQTGHRIRCACPYCEYERGKKDTKSALSVEAATGLYYCWRCKSGGKLDEPPRPGVVDSREASLALGTAVEMPDGFMPLAAEPFASAEATAPARAYLAKRGVSAELVRELGIGVVLDGYYAGRVIVPIEAAGALRGWVGRDYTGRAEKSYLYPRGMSRGYFFNHGAVETLTEEPLLVVEGVFDALALWPHAVAVLGQATRAHREMLRACYRPVVWVLDPDVWDTAWASAQEMRLSGRRCGALRLPPGTDPDEMPREVVLTAARLCLDEAL